LSKLAINAKAYRVGEGSVALEQWKCEVSLNFMNPKGHRARTVGFERVESAQTGRDVTEA
jgi:hypothetical protein